MVSKKKIEELKKVTAQLGEYPVVGILNMHKMPAGQLHEIRNKLRGKAVIRMTKKAIMKRAFDAKKLGALEPYVKEEPALFLTKENPFKIAKVIQLSTSEASARPGDIAPKDIIIPEGPTNLPPGPAIGELQKVKIPAGVVGDKIVVKKETVLVREGGEITKDIANVLAKLEIKPMEISLDLRVVWENGTVYEKDVLFLPADHYTNGIMQASAEALNLSVHINYCTRENIPILIGKVHREAEALAHAANIITPATIKSMLGKAHNAARVIEGKTKP